MIYIIMGFACPKPKAERPLRGRTLSQTKRADHGRPLRTTRHARFIRAGHRLEL